MAVNYEIDFIGVSQNQSSTNADAICFRWETSCGYKIAVYDVGLKSYGEELVQHLNRYYFNDPNNVCNKIEKKIDYLIISHPHQDHVSGFDDVIKNFNIGTIYMNRPWLYKNELKRLYSQDDRITPNSILAELNDDFSLIKHIEEVAYDYNIEIKEAFQEQQIDNRLFILSPSENFYLQKIAASTKTKRLVEATLMESVEKAYKEETTKETWYYETLREGESTDAENETSIVLLGYMDDECFLLTGDAGNEALNQSIIFANSRGCDLSKCIDLYEVPHHGSRHNVSPSVLDSLLGTIVNKGERTGRIAIASVAEISDHPKKIVVNAFKRRGINVYATAGSTFWYHCGEMPERDEFIYAEELPFFSYVESWN